MHDLQFAVFFCDWESEKLRDSVLENERFAVGMFLPQLLIFSSEQVFLPDHFKSRWTHILQIILSYKEFYRCLIICFCAFLSIHTFIWFLTNGHFLLLENGAYPDITAQNRAVQNPNALKTFQSSFPLLMNIFIVLATFLRRHRKIFNLLFFNRYFLPLSWSQPSSSSSSLRLSSQG